MDRFPNFSLWRDRLLLVVVALLPWQGRFIKEVGQLAGVPWEQGTVSLYALEIPILAALLCHVLSRAPKKSPPPFLRFWTLFVLYAAVSIFWAGNVDAGLFTWFHLFEGFALAYLIWVSKLPIKTLLRAFLIGATFSAALGLFQFFTQTSFSSTWLGIADHPAAAGGASVVETAAGRFLRAYGALPHPNIFGGFAAAGLIAAAALFVDEAERRRRPFLLVLSFVQLAALAVSFSRSAWAAAAIVIVSAVFTNRRWSIDARAAWKKWLLAIAVAAAALALVVWPLAASRLVAAGRLEQKSVSDRARSIIEAVQLFGRHYAIGVGLGNMAPAAYEELGLQLDNGYGYQPAHFVPALVAAELGFFGLMLLLGAVVWWLMEMKIALRLPSGPAAHLMKLLPLVVITVGLFDHYPITFFAGTLLSGFCFGLFLKAEDLVA